MTGMTMWVAAPAVRDDMTGTDDMTWNDDMTWTDDRTELMT